MTDAVHDSSKGIQDYTTPMPLIRLVEARFNLQFVVDLAAHEENYRCPQWIGEERNTLTVDWKAEIARCASIADVHPSKAAGWLNPPFGEPKKFMPYCAAMAQKGARFATLTLADQTNEWYRKDVRPNAGIFPLIGRVTFKGQTQGYTKGLMICLWGMGFHGTMDWDWREDPLYVG